VKCLNCNTIILKTGLQFKDGSFALATGESKKIEHDKLNRFVRCPNCKAKNILGDVINNKINWSQETFVSSEID
jgi:hypothetical protein